MVTVVACGGPRTDEPAPAGGTGGASGMPAGSTVAARPTAIPTAGSPDTAAPGLTERPDTVPAPGSEKGDVAAPGTPAVPASLVARIEADLGLPADQWPLNILILGIDKAESFEGNTDVMMLVSVDPHSQSVFVLSIPRDLCLGPCEGHSSRINEVYKRKGLEELQRTIRNVTGLFVDHWIKVNFYGVESIIDALGGVRVQVSRDFDERLVYLDTDEEIRLYLEQGWNDLNGREAVAYARSRKYDAGGDFARICRQQQVLVGLREQALTPILVVGAPALLLGLNDAFRTDLPPESLPALGQLLIGIAPERIHTWTIHQRDGDLLRYVQGEDGANLLRPDFDAIRDFVQTALAISADAQVAAEDGTTSPHANCEGIT